MTSINGRPVNENIKTEIENIVNDIKEMLESFRTTKCLTVDPDMSAMVMPKDPESKHLCRALRELREVAASFSTLDQLIEMFPWWTRIFHTRHRTAVSTDYALFRFVQIGPYAVALDPAKPALKFTPEDSQDYVTLRYKKDSFTPEDFKLIKCIESLDRMTVLSLWLDGHPVHQALVPYIEDMLLVHVKGVDDIPIFQIPISFLWGRQHQLRWQKNVNGKMVDIPDFEHGMCLPDHSCCNQDGMFEKEVRQMVFNSTPDQRELMQQENLLQRMKKEYDAQRRRE